MKKNLICLLAVISSGFCVSAQTLSNYQATVKSQSPNYYFTFDNGSLTSTTNGVTLLSQPASFTQFTYDVFRNAGDAAFFSAATDALVDTSESSDHIITGGGTSNTSSTATGSVSFLFKSLDPGALTAQKYIFSAGIINTNHNAFSLYFENTNVANGDPQSLKLRFGETSVTILQSSNVLPDTWYYFAVSYNETATPIIPGGTNANKATWYLGIPGGTLASGMTTNTLDAVAGDGTSFYIGNRPATDEGFRTPGTGLVDEFATWNRQLSATEISNQFAKIPNTIPPARTAYESVVSGESPFYYFKMDGNFTDSVGNTLTLSNLNATNSSIPVALTYDYFGGPTNAALISLAGDALTNNGNLLNGGGTYTGNSSNGVGSISFLFRTLNSYVNQGNRYLYQAGGSPATSNRFELWFNTFSATTEPEALRIGFGDSATTILPTNSFIPATWYYFAMTYDESKTNKQVTWWVGLPGGTLTTGTLSATNGSLAGQGNVFVIGSSTNLLANSYRNSTPSGTGRIQDFAIWHRALAGTEVTNQFNALVANTTVASPKLGITSDGVHVILSWPASSDPGFVLQYNTNLNTTNWSSAGSAVTVGTNYVVTNTPGLGAQFYRLKK